MTARTILLTWNPDKWPALSDDWDAHVEQTAQGGAIEGTWSVGNRVRGVAPGDIVFLLRQGTKGRGLIARGEATSEPFKDMHWDGGDRTTSYIDVRWHQCVPVEERVDTNMLLELVDQVPWNHLQSSGVEVREPAASSLNEIWSQATSSSGLG